jgi:hypothetical protein
VTTPAGGYPDPDARGQRYYDADTRTEQHAQAYASAPPPAHKGPTPIVWALVGLALVPVLPVGGWVTVLTDDFIEVGKADRAAHLTTPRRHAGFFRCWFRRQSVPGMGGLDPLHRARPHQVKAKGVGPHGDRLGGTVCLIGS